MSITKQRLLCGVIPVLLLILAVSPVCFAQDDGYVNAEPHLRLGAGARSIGLGGAFTAIAEDATATVWNPAGLGSAADLSLNISTQQISDQGILGQSRHFIALTKTLGSYGAIGLAATNFSVDDIPRHTDADGVEDGARFSRSVNAYSLSYGIAVGHFNIGLTGRMLMDNFGVESVENQSGFGGVDIGLMGHALHIDVDENQTPTFHYGIVAKYLGASLGEGTVPMVVDVGVAYDLYMGNVVTFSADIEQEFVNLDESPFSMRAGVEYTILTNKSTEFALRAGVRASRDNQDLFGGFGVNIAGLQVDYAIQDGINAIQGVGITHYLSLSYGY
ncbi:MAG: hypothetical protein OXI43_08135 [Candidatus Poribacteria bacterium]|nr:hypothetical protein [Candidatus Poribacteria bacterium]